MFQNIGRDYKGMDHPKVSVIIPVYNSSNTLNELLLDLKSQTFQSAEFILINDGSSDDSGDRITNFIEQTTDSRFRYINQRNQGVSVTRNTGIEMARGDYLMFADADDRLDRQFIEGYYTQIVQNKTDIEIFPLVKIDNPKTQHPIGKVDYMILADKYLTPGDYFNELANGVIYGYVVSYISKRSLWNDVRFDPSVTYREDELVYCQIVATNKNIKIHVNDRAYYSYYIHGDNAVRRMSSLELENTIEVSKKIIELAGGLKDEQVTAKRMNQLISNFCWSALVAGVVKNNLDLYRQAKRACLKYFPNTNFYSNHGKRRLQYWLLKLNFDRIVKIIINRKRR